MSFKGITFAIFIIIALAAAGLFLGLPFLASQPQNILAGICAGAGLVLFAVLSSIVYAIGRASEKKAGGGKKREEQEPRPSHAPAPAIDEKVVQVLSILQKKGRLIDFLREDISSYEDGQIGAAVRNIHRDCLDAISEYVTIEPVMKDDEGSSVIVNEGFDPSSIRLTGNVAGEPPFRGTLQHAGWRVLSTELPPLPEGQDPGIIEPAEVEIQ